jgi:hypothetical protein
MPTRTSEPRLIEQWAPDLRSARGGWRAARLARALLVPLALAAMIACVASGTMLAAFVVMILATALLLFLDTWVSQAARTRVVTFVLTDQSVRVQINNAARELDLTAIERIDVVRLSGRRDVGHVVFRRRGDDPALSAAIPTGFQVRAASVVAVTWASIQTVDPEAQLHEGALTFWYIHKPAEVRSRIEGAIQGISPYATGPHR